MSLIICPECGKQVSNAAQICPVCGYPIARKCSTKIKIKIDQAPPPNLMGYTVHIFNEETHLMIKTVSAGSVAEIDSVKPLKIYFTGPSKFPMASATVEPGKSYCATWGAGLFSPKIVACHEIDIMDS